MRKMLIHVLAMLLILTAFPVVLTVGLAALLMFLAILSVLAIAFGLIHSLVYAYAAGEKAYQWFKMTAGTK